MAFNLNEFITAGLEFGGARPSLFQVELFAPTGLNVSTQSIAKLTFMCQAAALPAATLSQIEVPYFGRKIKVAGERTFDNWTITVMNDEDFQVRSLFEVWSNSINSLESNIRQPDFIGENYKADLQVTQFSKDGSPIRAYTIVGAFPTEVSAIELNWNSTGTVETFTSTLAYDYWLPVPELEGAIDGQNIYGQVI